MTYQTWHDSERPAYVSWKRPVLLWYPYSPPTFSRYDQLSTKRTKFIAITQKAGLHWIRSSSLSKGKKKSHTNLILVFRFHGFLGRRRPKFYIIVNSTWCQNCWNECGVNCPKTSICFVSIVLFFTPFTKMAEFLFMDKTIPRDTICN